MTGLLDFARENGALIRTWMLGGIECAMVRGPLIGVNGYVKVPASIVLPRDKEYGYIDLDVHGGITYGPDRDGWIGFDTAHGFDVWLDPDVPEDKMSISMREAGIDNPLTRMDMMGVGSPYTVIWTLEKLEAEVNSLAVQIHELVVHP